MAISPILTVVIVLVALYGLCVSKNIVKSIILFNVMEAAVILFFLSLVYMDGLRVPIRPEPYAAMVDPVPQALMITAVVIGAGVTSLALLLTIKVYRQQGTLEWDSPSRGGE